MIKQFPRLLFSKYFSYTWQCYNALLVGLVCTASILVFSCERNSVEETEEMSIEDNIDMLYEKHQEAPTLDTLYFLPSTKEKILEYKPEIVEEIFNNKLLLDAYQEELDIDLKDEIIKYLNRKKNYDKSKIFSEVP